MQPAAPSAEAHNADVSPGSLTHGDWQEALGLNCEDIFESQAALLAVEGEDEENELDVMGSLLAEYNADDAAAAAEAASTKPPAASASANKEDAAGATSPAAPPALAKQLSARHRVLPDSVTAGRARRENAGKAPKRLSETLGVRGVSDRTWTEEVGAEKAAAEKETSKEKEDKEAEGEAADASAAKPRKKKSAGAKEGADGADDGDACMREAEGGGGDDEGVQASAWSSTGCEEEDAFALALGPRQWSEEQNPHEEGGWCNNAEAAEEGAAEWGRYGGEDGAKGLPPRKRPRKPKMTPEEKAAKAAAKAAAKGAADGAEAGALPMVKRGSSASLASAATASSSATIVRETSGAGGGGVSETTNNLASSLYDVISTDGANKKAKKPRANAKSGGALSSKSVLAIAPREGSMIAFELPLATSTVSTILQQQEGDAASSSIAPSLPPESVAGSDVGGKAASDGATDELELGASATRPASRNNSSTSATTTATNNSTTGAAAVATAPHPVMLPGGVLGLAQAGLVGTTPDGTGGLTHPMAMMRGSKFERKDWTAEEDEIIRLSVQTYGPKWRKIAARLPGRSDDAVRNRWNRVNEEPTLLVGVRGGANSLIDTSSFLSEGEVAEDGCIGIDELHPKKRPRAQKKVASATAAAAAALGVATLPEAPATLAGGCASPPLDDAASDAASQATTAPPPVSASASCHVDYTAAPVPDSLGWVTKPVSGGPLLAAPIAYAMPVPPSIQSQIRPPPAAATTTAKPKPKRSRASGGTNGEGGGAPASNRVVWSHSEDFIILRYVRDHGHDWKTLAEKLTVNARTPHAIRNRYHRLQAMALDTNVEGASTNELMAESASMLMDSSLLSA